MKEVKIWFLVQHTLFNSKIVYCRSVPYILIDGKFILLGML
ncbi:hypothetical protein [Flagellimonas pelagia]|nr:hypothetical protein [Allomuricauda maritima]